MDVTFNIAKGREVEFYERVNASDPTNSALILMLLRTGSVGVSGLVDFDSVAAILAGGYTELSVSGYARKTLTDADLDAWSPDDTNNRVTLALPIQTFSALAAGQTIDIGVVGYDSDTTSGTDSNIVPVTAHELRISGTTIPTNGDDILWDLSTNGWVVAA
jgi:hypothetical protein